MIVEKLKIYIDSKGIKKNKIAENLGITNIYLSYILNGKRTPSIDLEEKIRKLIM